MSEGGDGGGRIIAAGTPENVAATKESYTGQYLRDLLGRRAALRSSEGTEDVNPQCQKAGKRQAAE